MDVLTQLQARLRDVSLASSMSAVVLCSLIIILYLFSFIHGADDFFALTPAHVFPPHFHLWTLVTANIFERSIIYVICDIAVVAGIARFIEPLWGRKELLRFTAVVMISSMLGTFTLAVMAYALSRDERLLFNNFSGFGGVMAGFAVILKQLIPERKISERFPFGLRSKDIPAALTVLVSTCTLLRLVSDSLLPLVCCGLLSSWVYLRYFQWRDGVRGDKSEAFALASFFPDMVQPLVVRVSNVVYSVFVKIRLCPKLIASNGGSCERSNVQSNNVAGDADRQRAIALKALEQHMIDTVTDSENIV